MASKTPVHVTVTGAAGQIGYALLFRIASGAVFGPDQPVALNLIEVGPGLNALTGVVMELQDCAFPLLTDVVATGDLDVDDLVVSQAHVGKALVIKRFHPRGRGHAGKIMKPFSHLTIVVRQVEAEASA